MKTAGARGFEGKDMDEATKVTEKNEPKVIRNKDIPLLCDLLAIMQEVRRLESKRDWQHDRMFSITKSLSGMPGGGGMPTGFDDAMAKLSELEEQQEEQIRLYIRKMREAEKILNSIESVTMRSFVSMRYVENYDKKKIMDELGMKEWGFRRACEAVEQAERMALVKWSDRFVLEK